MERHLPPPLVSPAALAAVQGVATLLPAALSSWGYLECRLEEDDARVDLILRVDVSARDIVAGTNPAITLAAPLRAAPAWRRLRAFAREWAEPGSRLHRQTRVVWTEFDVEPAAAPGASARAPGVFVGFPHAVATDGSWRGRARGALAALAPLAGGALPSATARAVAACHAHLPPGAFVPYAGLFPHRDGPTAVRLCVAGLDTGRLLAYLRALSCAGADGAAAALLAELARTRTDADVPHPVLLHLDVSDRVAPRFGVEYACAHGPQLRGGLAEAAFLERLVSLGLCTPAKRAALAGWPGCSAGPMPHELWPSLRVRRLNHVKVVLSPGAPPRAKAYLSFHHVPRPRR